MFDKSIISVLIASSAIAPQIAIAQTQTTEMNISVTRQNNESYDAFLQRAEDLAKSTITERFTQDKSLPELALTVMGETQGMVAPVFMIQVTRQRWNVLPSPKQWATYFSSSKYLLGFEQPVTPQPSTAASPETPPPPTTPPADGQNTTPPPPTTPPTDGQNTTPPTTDNTQNQPQTQTQTQTTTLSNSPDNTTTPEESPTSYRNRFDSRQSQFRNRGYRQEQ